MPKYDLLVFIGRFQPVHHGHLAVINAGLEAASHLLILTGSARRPRSVRDPFTVQERAQMIRACLTEEQSARVQIRPLDDAMYNDPVWIRNVHAQVDAAIAEAFPGRAVEELQVGLVGHSKDRSSYYLNLFPTWGSVDVPNAKGISATTLREAYFGEGLAGVETQLRERVPGRVLDALAEFARTDAYAELADEQVFINRYRSQFEGLRYPVQFNTADAVVIQSGHILLVQRGARPGLGQRALPGGFIRTDEAAQDAAIRELREETRLKVPEPVLRGSISAHETFDDPHRSTRGRTFTTAFRFDLRPSAELPKVKGGDDAKDAFWLPLARVRPEEMFEDHYFIIQKMVGI